MHSINRFFQSEIYVYVNNFKFPHFFTFYGETFCWKHDIKIDLLYPEYFPKGTKVRQQNGVCSPDINSLKRRVGLSWCQFFSSFSQTVTGIRNDIKSSEKMFIQKQFKIAGPPPSICTIKFKWLNLNLNLTTGQTPSPIFNLGFKTQQFTPVGGLKLYDWPDPLPYLIYWELPLTMGYWLITHVRIIQNSIVLLKVTWIRDEQYYCNNLLQ